MTKPDRYGTFYISEFFAELEPELIKDLLSKVILLGKPVYDSQKLRTKYTAISSMFDVFDPVNEHGMLLKYPEYNIKATPEGFEVERIKTFTCL